MRIRAALTAVVLVVAGLLGLLLLLADEPKAAAGGCGVNDPTIGAASSVGEAPGPLGGIADTGIRQDEYNTVAARGSKPARITAGEYKTTAYGPPWNAMNGAGIATSAGLRLNGGAPSKYFIAVDPTRISYGAWVYIQPNPFNWDGPFLAADTGGAIKGNRIDFYDWRGRTAQMGWGIRSATVSATAADGSSVSTDTDDASASIDTSVCDFGSATAGALQLPGQLSRAELAAHPQISFTSACARTEIVGGITDQRIVDVLGAVITSGRSLIITALRCDHGRAGSNHAVGRAADIGSVAGTVCNPYGPSDACGKLAIELGLMTGRWKSDELIASFDPSPADSGAWADPAGHYHHIHLGYKTG